MRFDNPPPTECSVRCAAYFVTSRASPSKSQVRATAALTAPIPPNVTLVTQSHPRSRRYSEENEAERGVALGQEGAEFFDPGDELDKQPCAHEEVAAVLIKCVPHLVTRVVRHSFCFRAFRDQRTTRVSDAQTSTTRGAEVRRVSVVSAEDFEDSGWPHQSLGAATWALEFDLHEAGYSRPDRAQFPSWQQSSC